MTEMMPYGGPIYVFINGRSVGRASNVVFEANASGAATSIQIEMEEENHHERQNALREIDRQGARKAREALQARL